MATDGLLLRILYQSRSLLLPPVGNSHPEGRRSLFAWILFPSASISVFNEVLVTSAPAPTATPDSGEGKTGSYTAYVVSANKKSVHARNGASKNNSVKFNVPYGAAVTVLEHGKKWDHIQYNGQKGYMDNSFLRLQKPSDAVDPVVTPAPTPFQAYTTTVKVNDLNFHKKMGDWSSNVDGVGRLQAGYEVEVLAINGGWAKVSYNGHVGWVHKEFLNAKY